MTKPSKKMNNDKSVKAQGSETPARRKKPRMTAHRRAASKSEVRERIKLLRRRWTHANDEERRARVAELLKEGCSVRGIAHDIHQPESTLRCYSQPSSNSAEMQKQEGMKPTVPPTAGPRKAPIQPAPSKTSSVFTMDRSARIHSGKKLRKLPPKPVPKSPGEREQPVASLRRGLSELIVGFALAKWGIPKNPVMSSKIPNFLAALRTHIGRQWTRPVELLDRMSPKRLFQLTEPQERIDNLDWEHKGRWLAITLTSLHPEPSDYGLLVNAIGIAERELVPPPESAQPYPLVDDQGLPLKPHELRWRTWANRIARQSS